MSVKSLEPEAKTARQPREAEAETVPSRETAPSWIQRPVLEEWKPSYSPVLLVVLTLACLLPFIDKAFHIDDTLFVMAAKQIAKHPLNPYGFLLVWVATDLPMWAVT